MATIIEREKTIDDVSDLLSELSEIDAKTLGRTDELSRTINFEKTVPIFTEYLSIIKELNDRDIYRLSSQQAEKIRQSCNILNGLIKEVQGFDMNQNTPGDICNAIILKVENSYDQIMDPLIVPLAFTATQATDYAKIEREAKGYNITIKAEHDKLIEFIEQSKTNAEKALNAVRDLAAEAGVSTNAQVFIQNSTNYETASQNWFKATIWTSGATFIAALAFLITSFLYTPATIPESIQYIVSKIIVLSSLSFGIYWSVRNYKSNKHNQTLNQHRANALQTFQSFYEGSDNPQVKNAILLQAANAAFSSRPTGYDSSEKELPTINPIVEILGKTFTKASTEAS